MSKGYKSPSLATRRRVFERDDWRCVECGYQVPEASRFLPYRKAFGRKLTVDHIYPRSLGGSDAEVNLRAMCVPCNGRKSNTILEGACNAS